MNQEDIADYVNSHIKDPISRVKVSVKHNYLVPSTLCGSG